MLGVHLMFSTHVHIVTIHSTCLLAAGNILTVVLLHVGSGTGASVGHERLCVHALQFNVFTKRLTRGGFLTLRTSQRVWSQTEKSFVTKSDRQNRC